MSRDVSSWHFVLDHSPKWAIKTTLVVRVYRGLYRRLYGDQNRPLWQDLIQKKQDSMKRIQNQNFSKHPIPDISNDIPRFGLPMRCCCILLRWSTMQLPWLVHRSYLLLLGFLILPENKRMRMENPPWILKCISYGKWGCSNGMLVFRGVGAFAKTLTTKALK